MPIGSSIFSGQAGAAANVGTLVGGSAQVQSQIQSPGGGGTPPSLQKAPIVLTSLIALYVLWAILVQKESIREQLSPANVAVNLHNLIVVGLTAMVFLLIGKLATAKATIIGVPGASWLAQLFQAA